jgi:hypothetical protein
MKDIGYIISEKMNVYRRKYLEHPNSLANPDYFKELAEQFEFIQPNNYKGIGRTILESTPFYPDNNGNIEITEQDINLGFDNLKARREIAKIRFADNEFEDFENEFYFKNYADVENVFRLLENSNDYEILKFTLDSNPAQLKLGFDIGWLNGYSIICDTCITPMWHPPDFEDMNDILIRLKLLNENCLFNDYVTATDYLECYKNKSWGEKGDFTIYQILEVLPAANIMYKTLGV